MSSINDIDNQLRSIEERLDNHTKRLEKCNMDISDAVNKAQNEFGDTKEGQELANALYTALRFMSTVAGPLSALKSNLNSYIGRIHQ